MEQRPNADELLPERFVHAELLGRGAQGHTFRALDRVREKVVAVKVFSPAYASDWKALELFEREHAVLQSLNHPGVPRYIDHVSDESRGCQYLVMEYVAGTSLAQDIERGRRHSEKELSSILEQLVAILEYLHGLHPPVIHRDIKPGNIIRQSGNRVVLVDFGAVAKTALAGAGTTMIGTPGYIAPEALHGEVGPANDFYAAGATIAALAAGIGAEKLPRKGVQVELGPVLRGTELRVVVEALLDPDPKERPVSAAAIRELWSKPRALAIRPRASLAKSPRQRKALDKRADAQLKKRAAQASLTSIVAGVFATLVSGGNPIFLFMGLAGIPVAYLVTALIHGLTRDD